MPTGQAKMRSGATPDDGPTQYPVGRRVSARRIPASEALQPASASVQSSIVARGPNDGGQPMREGAPRVLRRLPPSSARVASDEEDTSRLEPRPLFPVVKATRVPGRRRNGVTDRGDQSERPRGASWRPGYRLSVRHIPLVAILLAFIGGGVLEVRYAEMALPGVRLGDVALGGMGAAELSRAINAAAVPLVTAPVTFTHMGREWRPAAREIGMRVGTEEMQARAMATGRTWVWPLRWVQALTVPLWRPDVMFRAEIDRMQLSAYLEKLASGVNRSPVEATLSIKAGQIILTPAVNGERVDVEAATRAVRVPATLADRQTVPLPIVVAQPRTSQTSIADAHRFAQKVMAGPLFIRVGDQSWSLSLAQLESMVEVRREVGVDGGYDRLLAGLNETYVAAFVKTIAQQVDRASQDGQFRWDGKAIVFTRDGQDGLYVDQAMAVRTIMQAAAEDSRDVVIPVTVSKPAVSSSRLASMGIKDLVGVGSSRYTGSSPERANNVKVAAGKLHHTLIQPGAIFSFLESLGPITPENGYLEGLTILGDATVPGIGGGVCQVSTTMFRAAFWAGLPIVERHQHAYRVIYYEQDGSPVGFDAAVYDPGVDLRFKNDTSSPLLVHLTLDESTKVVTFRLFGEVTGREIKLTSSRANERPAPAAVPDVPDPKLPLGQRKQAEWKADGVDAVVRRVVTVKGKQSLSDSFSSRYAPWQEKWAIGTGAVGPGTPPAVRAAVAQGVLVPGTPGLFVALRTLLSPTAAAEPAPAPVAPNPAPVAPNPALVAPNPALVAPNPAPVAPNPAPVAPNPALVAPNPALVAPNPAPVAPNPAPVAPNPTPVVVSGAPALAGTASGTPRAPSSVPETPTIVKPRT